MSSLKQLSRQLMLRIIIFSGICISEKLGTYRGRNLGVGGGGGGEGVGGSMNGESVVDSPRVRERI